MAPVTLAYVVELLAFALLGTALQGTLLWVSWQLLRPVIPASRPGLRYRVASAHLMLLSSMPLLTIAVLHLFFTAMGGEILRDKPSVDLAPVASDPPYVSVLGLIALCWFAGVMAHSIKLLRELARLGTMRLGTPPTGLVAAVERLQEGQGAGGSRVQVGIAAVSGPQVVGLRRATLMVPKDFMTVLPPAERDAILLHELAHARRHDFAWNLIQRFGLALVWFHPAAWSLYRSAGLEREAICDASAVDQGASPRMLAQGLVQLAEGRRRQTIAMASAAGAALGERVHRLVSPAMGTVSPWRRLAAGSGVLALFGVAMGLAEPWMHAARIKELYIASDFGPTVIVNARDPAGTFALRIRQGKVVHASIGHQSVPREHIIQKGELVVLLGANRRPAVSLRVFANGRIRWDARG